MNTGSNYQSNGREYPLSGNTNYCNPERRQRKRKRHQASHPASLPLINTMDNGYSSIRRQGRWPYSPYVRPFGAPSTMQIEQTRKRVAKERIKRCLEYFSHEIISIAEDDLPSALGAMKRIVGAFGHPTRDRPNQIYPDEGNTYVMQPPKDHKRRMDGTPIEITSPLNPENNYSPSIGENRHRGPSVNLQGQQQDDFHANRNSTLQQNMEESVESSSDDTASLNQNNPQKDQPDVSAGNNFLNGGNRN